VAVIGGVAVIGAAAIGAAIGDIVIDSPVATNSSSAVDLVFRSSTGIPITGTALTPMVTLRTRTTMIITANPLTDTATAIKDTATVIKDTATVIDLRLRSYSAD
jgi:hypothetical protein